VHIINKFLDQDFQKLDPEQDRHTHRRDRRHYHAALVDDKMSLLIGQVFFDYWLSSSTLKLAFTVRNGRNTRFDCSWQIQCQCLGLHGERGG